MEYALLLFFPFLMIYASASDLVSMTIPNRISLALIAGFVFFSWWTGMDLRTFGAHWAMFAIVLALAFTMFALGTIGGGDAKLAASTALWFGWEYTLAYFIIASFIGGALTLLMLRLRGLPLPDRLEKVEWIKRLYSADRGIPYGIALGASALIIFPSTSWMQDVIHSLAQS